MMRLKNGECIHSTYSVLEFLKLTLDIHTPVNKLKDRDERQKMFRTLETISDILLSASNLLFIGKRL